MKSKILLFSICLALNALQAQSVVIYADPTNGNDNNAGTIDSPLKTIAKAVSKVGSDGKIFLRQGVFSSTSKISLSKKNTSTANIKIWAYQNEKVVVDFTGIASGTDGFSLSGYYYHLKGLEIKNATHNGINISGRNNIVENCMVHHCGNTGIHITGGQGTDTTIFPTNNYVINCDSYLNCDLPDGGNADGFSAKWGVGQGNIFKGCRAYNNSDDGWDLWMASPGTIIIDSCMAFRNGVDVWGTGISKANGNGFKVGGNYIATKHIVRNCIAFDNSGNAGRGYDENNNPAGQIVLNCTAFRNKGDNFHFTNTVTSGSHNIKNCLSVSGNINISSGTLEKNSWQGFNISDTDFISIDTSLALAKRNLDGSLANNDLFKLRKNSQAIDAGVDVGISYKGKAPDLGAYETDYLSDIIKCNDVKMHGFMLKQNYPNPFNPETTIYYSLPEGTNNYTNIKVFDVQGKEVVALVNEKQKGGTYKMKVDARNLVSGVYFLQLKNGIYSKSIKMILIK